MKKKYLSLKKQALLMAFTTFMGASAVHAQLGLTSVTFAYTGATQSFTIPLACVNSITVDVYGAKGGTGYPNTHAGGKGGRVTGVIAVTAGQVLNINVGGAGANGTSSAGGAGGFNGGGLGSVYPGNYSGGGGGGASDIRVSPFGLADRVIVAGGGGGGAYNYGTTDYDKGGDGGGLTGGGGYSGNTQNGSGYPGGGATQGAGGVAGVYSGYCNGSPGVFGLGGAGGTCNQSGGGGGGGYYGGGGGVWSGGGGGSGYAAGTLSAVSYTQGGNNGNGYVVISYSFPPPSLNITASSTVVCSGNSITLNVSGSTSYTWGTGSNATSIVINPTSSSTYSVVGTGTTACLPYAFFTPSVVPLPNVMANSSTNFTVCPSTQITLTGSGANTYVWSNGVTNGVAFPSPSATTIYTVTGTDASTGCSKTNTVMLSIFPSTVGVSSSTAICSGQSAFISANGAMSYTWIPGGLNFQGINANPVSTTVYTVNALTSNFCPAMNTVTVSVNPSPTVSAIANISTICKGESANLTANGATTYSWSNAATTASIAVSPTVTTIYNVNGVSNGCTSNTATLAVIVNFCTGISSISSKQNSVLVYPNPSNGDITVKSDEAIRLNLINELGQVVKTISLSDSNNYQTSISNLTSGIYFIIGTNNNNTINQKIVVAK
jgi:hypothetical protein